MAEFGHRYACGNDVCIDSWSAGPFVIVASGRSFRFEDSARFGPHLVNKDGSIKRNPWPNERSPFWQAYHAWRHQKRRVADDGLTCIYDPLRGKGRMT